MHLVRPFSLGIEQSQRLMFLQSPSVHLSVYWFHFNISGLVLSTSLIWSSTHWALLLGISGSDRRLVESWLFCGRLSPVPSSSRPFHFLSTTDISFGKAWRKASDQMKVFSARCTLMGSTPAKFLRIEELSLQFAFISRCCFPARNEHRFQRTSVKWSNCHVVSWKVCEEKGRHKVFT